MGSLAAGNGASNGGGGADQVLALENGVGNGQHKASVVVADRAAQAPQGNGDGGGKAKTKISPKDKYWVAADEGEMAAATQDGGEDGRRPLLYRTFKVKGILLHPYRCVRLPRISHDFLFECRVACPSFTEIPKRYGAVSLSSGTVMSPQLFSCQKQSRTL